MKIEVIYSTNPQYNMKSKLIVDVPDSIGDAEEISKFCYNKIIDKTGEHNVNLWQMVSPKWYELPAKK